MRTPVSISSALPRRGEGHLSQDENTIRKLSDALSHRDRPTALRLVAALIDVEHCDAVGMRAIHLAVVFQDAELVSALVRRRAQVEAQTLLGNTPLQLALTPVGLGHQVSPEIVDCLVRAGAKGEIPSELAHLLAQHPSGGGHAGAAPSSSLASSGVDTAAAAGPSAELPRPGPPRSAPTRQPTDAEKLLSAPPLSAWFKALPRPWRAELADHASGRRGPSEAFDLRSASLTETLDGLARTTRDEPIAHLKLALTLAAVDPVFWTDIQEALAAYKDAMGANAHLLHPAWILACALEVSPATPGSSSVPLGRALLKLYEALLTPGTPNLCAHLDSMLAPLIAPVAVRPADASPSEEWARLAPMLNPVWCKKLEAPMSELMGLIGLPKVKRRVLDLIAAERAQATLPAESRIPQTLNFALLGNPGTGKTTVARLIGRILHAVGLRESEKFEEVTARKLMNDGLDKFHALLDKCLGGVLFIDEAYAFNPKENDRGREILEELLVAAETRRERLSIILAGYQREMEQKLFAYNEGLQSRVERVVLDDFTVEELNDVWSLELRRRKGWTQESEEIGRVVARRLARRSGTKGFGNAREVRREFERVAQKSLARRAHGPPSPIPSIEITLLDVVGAPPSPETHPELKRVLDEVRDLTGQRLVKGTFAQLVDTAAQNHNRELRGDRPLAVTLNRLFLGNPGTGKTTTAKLYGRLLRALGFLSDGEVLVCGASDLVGSYIGQSQEKTKALVELARGKVLLIDEAYALNDSFFGKQALDTLVEQVSGAPGEDIAVVMCGYEREMDNLLRAQNPGLSRRFPRDQALMFEDFTDDELMLIAVKKAQQEDLRLPAELARRVARDLGRKRAIPHFGNAGEVEQRLSVAKQRCASRQGAELTEIDFFGTTPTSSPLDELRALDVDAETLQRFARFEASMQVHARDGGSKPLIGHLQFIGNAGTGKTWAARLMGRFFHSIGVLARDHVEETNGLDLTGAFLGQTKGVVQERLAAAAGGILFVDEAYQLGDGPYGAEAITTLVQLMTEPRYDRDKTLIILAGYRGPMAGLMRSNQGLASRFKQRIEFADWSPERCGGLLARLANEERLELSEAAIALATEGCAHLARLPHWANARDVRTLFDEARGARAMRVQALPEPLPSLSDADVRAALEKLISDRRSLSDLVGAIDGYPDSQPALRSSRVTPAQDAREAPPRRVSDAQAVIEAREAAPVETPVAPDSSEDRAEESLIEAAQRELQTGADRLKAMKTLSRESAGEDSLEAALQRQIPHDPDVIATLADRNVRDRFVLAAIEDVISRQVRKGVGPDEARQVVEREAGKLLEHSRLAQEIKMRLEAALKRLVPVYKCGYCGRPWGTGPGQCKFMGPLIDRWEVASNVQSP